MCGEFAKHARNENERQTYNARVLLQDIFSARRDGARNCLQSVDEQRLKRERKQREYALRALQYTGGPYTPPHNVDLFGAVYAAQSQAQLDHMTQRRRSNHQQNEEERSYTIQMTSASETKTNEVRRYRRRKQHRPVANWTDQSSPDATT